MNTPEVVARTGGGQPPWAGWFSLDPLQEPGADDLAALLPRLRQLLKDAGATLIRRFDAGEPVQNLVHARAWLVDRVLLHCWRNTVGDTREAALVAVGGYGRGELLPGSDVDLMILLAQGESSQLAARLEGFLTFLWDIGLEVGHSVRTLDDCEEQARADVTVVTNLMEARLLDGPRELFEAMRERTGPDRIWPSDRFFEAKLEEQAQRYRRFDDAVYNLEPNIKEGPGGLRDVQIIGWVVKRHFGSDTLAELVRHGFLTEAEYRALDQGQQFLWKVRFGLHALAGRREDRLLFEYQRQLATRFGYHDSEHRLAVEHFMKDYYRTIQELSRLNEMLLQLFKEALLHADEPGRPTPINRRFQARRGFLEVVDDSVFRRYPFALLELFLVMQQHPELEGVRATTIRLVRENRHLIDEDFRRDIRARSLFMEIFRQPHGLTHELRRMNRYGILAAYYPPFGQIVGQMQHDLFHVYTVDEHTLMVVRNLRRMTVPEFADELPLCSRISKTIPKPELLYLAGFFHDIAKGRGGDHAELGAVDAQAFLAAHGLGDYDQKLVAWLVRHHLLMSQTAQRRDISDPEVINEFARQVGDRTRLDYLYLLTVADIRGTSPALWNSWKDALFKDLYTQTKRALRRGLENPLNRDEQIADVKQAALRALEQAGLAAERVEALWEDFPDDYFLRHNADEVTWHARTILQEGGPERTHVALVPESVRGGSSLFVYTPVVDRLFSRTTALLDQLGLSVTDARIITSRRGYAVNTFHVLDTEGQPLHDDYRAGQLLERLRATLETPGGDTDLAVNRSETRRQRQFPVQTRLHFVDDELSRRTILELITTDRPGLLSRVGRAFSECGIVLHNAKIATFGTQAEDVFYISDRDDQPLTEAGQACLRQTLERLLDD